MTFSSRDSVVRIANEYSGLDQRTRHLALSLRKRELPLHRKQFLNLRLVAHWIESGDVKRVRRAMEQGYEDSRFDTAVDKNFSCPICMNVLKDPLQCRKNEHYFCSPCIRRHLEQNSQSCPLCLEVLTQETLRQPPRIVAHYLSSLKISCDHAIRGCREVIELDALKSHVGKCDFSPVTCSNDGCEQIVNRQDLEQHETRACSFKKVTCDYCGEEVLSSTYAAHRCVKRNEIAEIKKNLTEMKSQLHHRSLGMQEEAMKEMKKEVKDMSSEMKVMREEMKKEVKDMSSEMKVMREEMKHWTTEVQSVIKPYVQNLHNVSCHAESQEDIIVVGGCAGEITNPMALVERFTWSDGKWTMLQQMKEKRSLAAAVVFNNQVLVSGGCIVQETAVTDSMEIMNVNEKPEQWLDFTAKLPFKYCGHKCVVYGNRLIVIGGVIKKGIVDSIHEVLLVPPYSSKLLCRMPQRRYHHGVELFKDKIVIAGGFSCLKSVQYLNSVVIYDITKNECKEMAPLPSALACMATVGWDDNMILIGGRDKADDEPINTVIAYDIKTGESKALPKMKNKRSGCTAVVSSTRIVVMGGVNDSKEDMNTVECFSFLSHSWEELSPMREPRTCATASIVKSRF